MHLDLCRKLRLRRHALWLCACFQSALHIKDDFSIHHVSGLRLKILLRRAEWLVLRFAHLQEDSQSGCSDCPECVRKNCSDKPWCNSQRSGSVGNDAHMQSRAKTHQVAVSGGSSDRIFQTCHCHFLSPLSPGKDASRLPESAGFVCHRPLSTWTAIGLPKLGHWYFEARCVLMMTMHSAVLLVGIQQ